MVGRGAYFMQQALRFPYFLLPFGVYIVKELFLCNYYNVQLLITETWSLTLREEHRLKVFENRVLRRISEPKRDQMVGS
jgi:hypothetical protein